MRLPGSTQLTLAVPLFIIFPSSHALDGISYKCNVYVNFSLLALLYACQLPRVVAQSTGFEDAPDLNPSSAVQLLTWASDSLSESQCPHLQKGAMAPPQSPAGKAKWAHVCKGLSPGLGPEQVLSPSFNRY